MWGSIAAAVGSALGSVGSAIYQNHSAKKLTNLNYANQVEAAQHAHQWEVEDLIKAGLNPALSAGGPGASLSGGGISNGTPMENPVTSALQASKTLQDTKLSNASANRENAQATQLSIQNKFMPQQMKSQIGQMDATTAKMNAETNLIHSQQELQSAINEVQANKGYQYYKAYGEPIVHGAAQGAGFAAGARIAGGGKGGMAATSAKSASKGFSYRPSDGGYTIYKDGKPYNWTSTYNKNPNHINFHYYKHY